MRGGGDESARWVAHDKGRRGRGWSVRTDGVYLERTWSTGGSPSTERVSAGK